MIPYGTQLIDQDDIDAVVQVLKGDWLTCGPAIEQFEQALAEYLGAKHVIALANGTAALHIAMLSAGIGPGDRVITSPITFLASANCAEFVGATADFADIDPATYNLSPSVLKEAWQPDVKAVVAVDFAGLPCDMPEISEIARKRGATIIEDASHAIGSRFVFNDIEYKVGAHPWTDMTTFSFHPVKTMTTGEGGAIATNDDLLAARCRLYRNHGIIKDPNKLRLLPSDLCRPTSEIAPWLYAMNELGYNYRITDIQCALGLSQLKKLDTFIARRQEIVDAYNAAFGDVASVKCPYQPSAQPQYRKTAWHLYVLQIDFTSIGKTRTRVMTELRHQGIGTQVHYIPVYLQPYYRQKYGYGKGKCPGAENYYDRCLSLPLYPAMSDDDVQTVITAVTRIIN